MLKPLFAFASLSLALSLPLAALAADTSAYLPEQLRPPAGKGGVYAYRPACTQLEAIPSENAEGWLSWGVRDARSQHFSFYGLEATLSRQEAFDWLEAAGVCVQGGAVVELISVEEAAARRVEAVTGEGEAPVTAGASGEALGPNPHEPGSYEWQLFENRRLTRERMERPQTAEASVGSGVTGWMGMLLGVGGLIFLTRQVKHLGGVGDALGKAWESVGPPPEEAGYIAPPSPPDNEPQFSDPRVVAEGLIETSVYDLILETPSVSRAVFGFQRSGKSNLVAQITKALAAKGYKIYHFNLASYVDPLTGHDEDAEYWGHCERSVRGDITDKTAEEAKPLIDEALECAQEFAKCRHPAILVADEWAITTPKNGIHAEVLKELAGFLASQCRALSSSGFKRRKSMFALAPKIVAGEMSQDGLNIKTLSPVLVAIAPGHTAEWGGQKISFSWEVFGQVNTNYGGLTEPPLGFSEARIGFINGRWLPLGVPSTAPQPPNLEAVPVVDSTPAPAANLPPAPAYQPARQPARATHEDPQVNAFFEWLEGKAMQHINYTTFKNANAFRDFDRSRENFNRLCHAALVQELIIKQSQDDEYWVLPVV